MKQRLLFVPFLIIAFIMAIGNDLSFAKQPEGDVEIQFRVKWDGKIIPGITKVSGLKRKTEVVTQRGGGDPNILRRSPGMTNYKHIIIQRPRSKDKEFERWANKVWNFGSGLGAEVSLRDFRKDIIIELADSNGNVLMAFKIYRCWPSEYVALSDLDADDDAPAMEKLVIEHEGWERDYDIE